MKKLLYILSFIIVPSLMFSQEGRKLSRNGKTSENDSIIADPTIDLFKIISFKGDTTHVDTSLTIRKDYKFNYLRKDLFGLLPFANTGQTYNELTEHRDFVSMMPKFGARARHYNFMEIEDIFYYNVPTPLTDLFFRTVPEQGQLLDASFSVNTSERLNFSIAYKGLRALGRYQQSLTSTGNFRTTINYQTKNKKYRAKAHFVSQDLMNQENGGLTDDAIISYRSKDEDFDDRGVLAVNFQNAENTLYGKRFYLNHQYYIVGEENSAKNKLYFGHVFDYSYKKFQFTQGTAATEILGESFENSNLRDAVRYNHFDNTVSINAENRDLGKLSGKLGYSHLDYKYNSVFLDDDVVVPNELSSGMLNFGGSYDNTLSGFNIHGEAMFSIGNEFSGTSIAASAGYQLDSDNYINFGLKQNSRAPNLNLLMYQSDYINYNWRNDYNNENSQSIFGDLFAGKIAHLYGEITQVQNYSYFMEDTNGGVKPYQDSGDVRYFKLKVQREFTFGKFSFDNTILYQKVSNGANILNLPEFITRNTIYFSDFWFDEALFLQTGITLNYFTSYNMNAYDPVLAEFYVQNSQSFGNYPVVDFFFNGKVDKARIFFKLENLNFLVDGNNNFSAPRQPHNDFMVRFGLVWNFFL